MLNVPTERNLNMNSSKRRVDMKPDTEQEDLIENYRFLTEHCGVLKKSNHDTETKRSSSNPPKHRIRSFSAIDESNVTFQSEAKENHRSPMTQRSKSNKFSNKSMIYRTNRPETSSRNNRNDRTIDDDQETKYRSFSLIKIFSRLKLRMKNGENKSEKLKHEILSDEEQQEWLELTKNVRTVLNQVLLVDGSSADRVPRERSRGETKKSRDKTPVLQDESEIDKLAEEETFENDEQVRKDFLQSNRGFSYRRCAVCKAIDRQFFQGQLVYFYGVANNILIDENLRASGLG